MRTSQYWLRCWHQTQTQTQLQYLNCSNEAPSVYLKDKLKGTDTQYLQEKFSHWNFEPKKKKIAKTDMNWLRCHRIWCQASNLLHHIYCRFIIKFSTWLNGVFSSSSSFPSFSYFALRSTNCFCHLCPLLWIVANFKFLMFPIFFLYFNFCK